MKYENLSDAAKACCCNEVFNWATTYQKMTVDEAQLVIATALSVAIEENFKDISSLDFAVKRALGEDVVEELRQFCS